MNLVRSSMKKIWFVIGVLLLVIVGQLVAAEKTWAAETDDDYIYMVTDSGTVVKRPVSGTPSKDHSTDSGSSTAKPNSTSSDSIMITRLQLEQGKVDLANLNMRESASAKSVYIEKSAMEYAAEQNMQIGMVTNYVTVRVPAAAIVNSDYWRRAAQSSRSFHFFFELDDVHGLDLNREYRTSEQIRLSAWPVSQQSVELEMYLRGSNNSYIYIEKLDDDVISIVYNYLTNYRTVNSRYPQQTLALLWCDTERRINSTYTANQLLASRTNLDTQTVEVRSPYAHGCYLLVSQSNADNRKTQLADMAEQGRVNTAGVPAWAAADVGALQAVSVVPEDLSGVKFNQPITRAEFAAYLVNVLSLHYDGKELSNPFKDVQAGHTYYEEILLAHKAGLLSGQTKNTFAPDAAITRQEMACMFTRVLNVVQHEYSTDNSKLAAMPDAGRVSSWARESVAVSLNTGLIAGTDGGRFAPAQTTTWTEAVVMLNRLYKLLH